MASAPRPGVRSSTRRRQRSVRVTVAVGLLGAATAVVLLSLPTRSPLWLSVASVTALVLSWAALRMMWTEVLQSRRENAADKAAAAAAYRRLFTVRAEEHAEFTTAMTERLAEAHISQRELEGLVTLQESRAQQAESRVQSLEETLAGLRAEGAADLAAWQDGATDPVAELVAWEEQAERKVRDAQQERVLRRVGPA